MSWKVLAGKYYFLANCTLETFHTHVCFDKFHLLEQLSLLFKIYRNPIVTKVQWIMELQLDWNETHQAGDPLPRQTSFGHEDSPFVTDEWSVEGSLRGLDEVQNFGCATSTKRELLRKVDVGMRRREDRAFGWQNASYSARGLRAAINRQRALLLYSILCIYLTRYVIKSL